VPVATVAINGATNAGLLCVRMLATHDEALAAELEAYRLELADQAKTQDENLPGVAFPACDAKFLTNASLGCP